MSDQIAVICAKVNKGLHQRDNDKLIKTLEDLRDLGNTIIVVEHDEDTIFASDYIIDIGPGAGVHGGPRIRRGANGCFAYEPPAGVV